MKKEVIFILAIAGLAAVLLWCFTQNRDLSVKLTDSQKAEQRVQSEIQQLQESKDSAIAENNKLKEDALSYVNLNTSLQAQMEAAEKKLKASVVIIKDKNKKISEYTEQAKQLSAKLADYGKNHANNSKPGIPKADTVGNLEKKLKELKAALVREKRIYRYNLAVAYTQAKLYDEAIIEYIRALEYNPNNAEAHYNLGLIYSNARFDPQRAVAHYKKYLALKPDTDDRAEVEGWIDKLE